MDNKFISIIIPVYKVEQYLGKCVDSVLNQTYKELEIILVDDGSPDHCPEICEEYAGKDSRIVVIHKQNGGLSSARNAGLDVAKGEYIFFLDSDDYIAENTIERMYQTIISEKADIAICDFVKVDENGEIIKELSPIKNECLNKEQLLMKLVNPTNWYYVVAWNKLYKKTLFSAIRFPVGKINEDEFTVHQIFYECNKAVTIAEKLYFYLRRKSSITTNSFSVKNLDGISALADRCLFLTEKGVFEPIEQTFSKMHSLYFCHRSYYAGLNKDAVKKTDKLFKDTYKKCKKHLSLVYRLMGMFPKTIWWFKSLRVRAINRK